MLGSSAAPTGSYTLASGNNQHFATPPLVTSETSKEIPY